MPDLRGHISSAVVMTHPRDTEAVAARLAAVDGVEVHGTTGGRIVVVIEGPHAGHLGDTLLAITAMDGVLAANMVFERAIEEEEMSDDGRTHPA
jgi:periplasmic nitrate reductase NapD